MKNEIVWMLKFGISQLNKIELISSLFGCETDIMLIIIYITLPILM